MELPGILPTVGNHAGVVCESFSREADAVNGWQGNTDEREMVRRWPRHPRCVGLARIELSKALAGWGLAEIEAQALVVLSELVTNAVRHAHVSPGRGIETRFRPAADSVRIEVHDAASERPRIRNPDAETGTGRGLLLVAALSSSWGVITHSGAGKAVWAVVPRSPRGVHQ